MRPIRFTVTAALPLCTVVAAASAATTGVTGSTNPAPIDQRQPSLALTQCINVADGTYSDLGSVLTFAGTYVPEGYLPANGALLNISEYPDLFSRLGITYGGNGVQTFALPNLQGRAITGAALNNPIGSVTGSAMHTLTVAELPAHVHTLPSGGTTAPVGSNQAFSNGQASLALTYEIATRGAFPASSISGGDIQAAAGSLPLVGAIRATAATNSDAIDTNYARAAGQSMLVAQNQALYSIVLNNYGGSGQTSYNLPNLTGNLAVGSSPTAAIGQAYGTATTSLNVSQLPSHEHAIAPIFGGSTGSTGMSAAVNNDQPSLPLSYIIATTGIFPLRQSVGGEPTFVSADASAGPAGEASMSPYLGEVDLFAGSFAPKGYLFCQGQLLPIRQYTALYSLLGISYGGDGINTFALPNLQGTTVIGTGTGLDGINYQLGTRVGNDTYTLSSDQLPAHSHAYVPEPSTLSALAVAGVIGGRRKRRRS